jgi:hypothetical protein
VNREITASMNPVLLLYGARAFAAALPLTNGREPTLVAPRQTRSFALDLQNVSVEGTLLLFNLTTTDISPYKSAVRVTPILEWRDPATGSSSQAIAPGPVYLGNMRGAVLWTLAIVLLVTLTVLFWAIRKRKPVKNAQPGGSGTPDTNSFAKSAYLLVTGPDGYLSLWRARRPSS